jgi:hypothetical protein
MSCPYVHDNDLRKDALVKLKTKKRAKNLASRQIAARNRQQQNYCRESATAKSIQPKSAHLPSQAIVARLSSHHASNILHSKTRVQQKLLTADTTPKALKMPKEQIQQPPLSTATNPHQTGNFTHPTRSETMDISGNVSKQSCIVAVPSHSNSPTNAQESEPTLTSLSTQPKSKDIQQIKRVYYAKSRKKNKLKPCPLFAQGRCARGARCWYSHDPLADNKNTLKEEHQDIDTQAPAVQTSSNRPQAEKVTKAPEGSPLIAQPIYLPGQTSSQNTSTLVQEQVSTRLQSLKSRPCIKFAQGRHCWYGNSCKYSHDLAPQGQRTECLDKITGRAAGVQTSGVQASSGHTVTEHPIEVLEEIRAPEEDHFPGIPTTTLGFESWDTTATLQQWICKNIPYSEHFIKQYGHFIAKGVIPLAFLNKHQCEKANSSDGTFTCFEGLPYELRYQIWSYALDETRETMRVITKYTEVVPQGEMKAKQKKKMDWRPTSKPVEKKQLRRIVPCHEPPALLRVNREARKLALERYKLGFSTTDGAEARCYFNFTNDTLFFGGSNPEQFHQTVTALHKSERNQIWQIAVPLRYWVNNDDKDRFLACLVYFSNLRKVYLLVSPSREDSQYAQNQYMFEKIQTYVDEVWAKKNKIGRRSNSAPVVRRQYLSPFKAKAWGLDNIRFGGHNGTPAAVVPWTMLGYTCPKA